MVIIILVGIFTICLAENSTKSNESDKPDKPDKSDKPDLSDTIGKVGALLENPAVMTAIEVLKSLKSESSTTISDRYDQTGFLSINNNYDYSKGAVLISRMDELISHWLNDNTYDFITDGQKKTISKALKEYTLQLAEDPYYKQKYELSFNDGKGSLFMMILSVSPHPTNINAIRWEKYILQTDFVPAPSYVIITESDCDILSCDRTDKIVYLPTVLNQAHMDQIISMNLGMLTGFTNSLYNSNSLNNPDNPNMLGK
ncbi:hypothetical protein QJ850_gp167 [Acanthamoeba polyphaga mimivirus]|uniref:Uncharacterized protein n=1 Tax=Acanthamoeba polyphaga mimivirus Kroon TaxID=3069720 RepID=A0A0G2Y9M3_9VIRU|nr:hypothetical protein QJ850_gp167 [Acanthamoeba polyphaga mimivirus]AKI80532.1 hypothetical protein [Acanthamoeba polyphaga mimivirus Kroon]